MAENEKDILKMTFSEWKQKNNDHNKEVLERKAKAWMEEVKRQRYFKNHPVTKEYYFIHCMDKMLQHYMDPDTYILFNEAIAKEALRYDIQQMEESPFKEFCEKNFDAITFTDKDPIETLGNNIGGPEDVE